MPNDKKEKLTVTSGAQWRKLREKGTPVQLPSGNVAVLRPVSFEELIRAGKIPNPLMDTLRRMMGLDAFDQADKPRDVLQDTNEMIDLMEIICVSAFLNPRIVDDPVEDDEISFFDVSATDREFVLEWVQGPLNETRPFRSE